MEPLIACATCIMVLALIRRRFAPIEAERAREIVRAKKIISFSIKLIFAEKSLEHGLRAHSVFCGIGSETVELLTGLRFTEYRRGKGALKAALLPLPLQRGYYPVISHEGRFMMITPKGWEEMFSDELNEHAASDNISLPRPHEVLIAIATNVASELGWAKKVLGMSGERWPSLHA